MIQSSNRNVPDWAVKVAAILLFSMASAWAAFVTQRSLAIADLRVRDTTIQAEIEKTRLTSEGRLELLNYKMDLLLRINGFDPSKLPPIPPIDK